MKTAIVRIQPRAVLECTQGRHFRKPKRGQSALAVTCPLSISTGASFVCGNGATSRQGICPQVVLRRLPPAGAGRLSGIVLRIDRRHEGRVFLHNHIRPHYLPPSAGPTALACDDSAARHPTICPSGKRTELAWVNAASLGQEPPPSRCTVVT